MVAGELVTVITRRTIVLELGIAGEGHPPHNQFNTREILRRVAVVRQIAGREVEGSRQIGLAITIHDAAGGGGAPVLVE